MEIAKILVGSTAGTAQDRKRIPSGKAAGLTVSVVFIDPIWDSLTKTVVFRGTGSKTAVFDGKTAVIPWEVLEKPDTRIYFGIYGTDEKTGLQLPLIEVPIGTTERAANPDADPGTEPTLPIWAQLQEDVEELQKAGKPPVPDWNAAEGEPGHIKNRTHWIERAYTNVMPETTNDVDETIGAAGFEADLVIGKTYRVKWNGTFYICTAYAVGDDGVGSLGGEGYPFTLDFYDGGIDAYPEDGSSTVTMAIDEVTETVHKIPEKFLPDSHGGADLTGYATEAWVREGFQPKGDSPAIIDVIELPTENIREDVFYRLLSGVIMAGKYHFDTFTVHCVEVLPETGLPVVNNDQTAGDVYYNVNDGECYGYVNELLAAVFDIPAGWYTAATLVPGLGFEYGGVVTDVNAIPGDNIIRVLLTYTLYSYKTAWEGMKGIGQPGTGYESVRLHQEAKADGEYSLGIGYGHAVGPFSISTGESVALGGSSFAGGGSDTYTGENAWHAFAYGDGAVAESRNQFVHGSYNIPDADGKYAHIIGNGLDLGKQSNAHTLDWAGNAWYQGNVYVGGTGQDDPQAVRLATMEDLKNSGGNADDTITTATVTGQAISVSDVAPEEHELSVKVSGVDDPTTVKVMRYSKNLIDVSADKLVSSVATAKATQEEDGVVLSHSVSSGWPNVVYKIGDYSLFAGKKLAYSCDLCENATRWASYVTPYDASGNKLTDIVSRTSNPTTTNAAVFTVPENSEAATLCLRFGIYSAATSADEPCKFKNLQLEFADAGTDYETPLGVQEAIPSADGAVSGLTSCAPTMNIITNNADAVLEVTYTKVAEEKEEVFDESEYAAYGLPILYMDGDTSTMTKDDKVTLDYRYGSRAGTCTAKWQGSSSLLYPKKNYTVTFDTAFEAVDGWGVHDKYCLKADWVDFSSCRNVVAAKLWGTVVKIREGVSETLSALPNGGAIDGFPCLVVINEKLQGVYNFTIPKEDWLMGMGTGSQEAYVCAEGTGQCGEWTAPVVGTDFDLEYVTDEDNADWVQTSLDALFAACFVDGIDETYINNTLSQYMDISSAIDYYIFAVLIGHADGILKNYLLGTHDGTKWFFSAYDMDLIFGQRFSSAKPLFVNSSTLTGANPGMTSFYNCSTYHKMMRLLYNHKKAEIIARYKELRETVLSPAVVAQAFYSYASEIPMLVYNKEAELWKARPNTAVNNVAQIVQWYQDRVLWLDKEIAEMEAAV